MLLDEFPHKVHFYGTFFFLADCFTFLDPMPLFWFLTKVNDVAYFYQEKCSSLFLIVRKQRRDHFYWAMKINVNFCWLSFFSPSFLSTKHAITYLIHVSYDVVSSVIFIVSIIDVLLRHAFLRVLSNLIIAICLICKVKEREREREREREIEREHVMRWLHRRNKKPKKNFTSPSSNSITKEKDPYFRIRNTAKNLSQWEREKDKDKKRDTTRV